MPVSKTIIVCRSCTIHPKSTPLTLDGNFLMDSDDLVVLCDLLTYCQTIE